MFNFPVRPFLLTNLAMLVLSPLSAEESVFLIDGENNNGEFGFAVEYIGDINNDGIDDFAVGEPGFPGGGRVRFYSGTSTPVHLFDLDAPAGSGVFGYCLTYVGRTGQIAIGDPSWEKTGQAPSEGAVYLYDATLQSIVQHIEGDGGLFGEEIEALTKGNEVAHFMVIGASGYSDGNKTNAGMFDVYRIKRNVQTGELIRANFYGRTVGANKNDRLGYEIASGPSVMDSAGYRPDFLVSTHEQQWSQARTKVYLMDADYYTFNGPKINIEGAHTALLHLFEAEDAGTRFGFGLAVHRYRSSWQAEERLHAVIGSIEDPSGGSIRVFELFGNYNELTDFKLSNVPSSDSLGWEIEVAGDINGDGFDDLLVGDISNNSGALTAGAAHLLSGRTYQLMQSYFGRTQQAHFGQNFATGLDINQDGLDDFLVGGEKHEGIGVGLQEGGVWGYAGTDQYVYINLFGETSFSMANDRLRFWVAEGTGNSLVDIYLYSLDDQVVDRILYRNMMINPFTGRVEVDKPLRTNWVGKKVKIYAAYHPRGLRVKDTYYSPIEEFTVTP